MEKTTPESEASKEGGQLIDAMPALKKRAWSVAESLDLYGVTRWGADYFGANEAGELTCMPGPSPVAGISLMEVVREARSMGLEFPLQIRFQDILQNRVDRLQAAFQRAISDAGYGNDYEGVYPVKVNQLREVVEEILAAGQSYRFGLEVGSKAELVAALAVNEDNRSPIICNGFKDDSFIRLALQGQRLGHTVRIVVEKADELKLVIQHAQELGVSPVIGVRLRLDSRGSGQWADSSGDRAKFGLNASEALWVWEELERYGMGQALQMLHFHIGSQIPDISSFRRAAREAARYYAKFIELGAPLKILDVGGGLAIDYDGSASTHASSMNYSVEEYARTIIHTVRDVCDDEKVPHPLIVSESGRYLVAHHAVLVVEAFANVEKGKETRALVLQELDSEHKIVREILGLLKDIEAGRELVASYHSLRQLREEGVRLFDMGLMELMTKAKIDDLYWHVAAMIVKRCQQQGHLPGEIEELAADLKSQYVCNFSIFQSLLDNWAIDQHFPILPIQRLDEKPDQRASLVDITCDSEGRLSLETDGDSGSEALPLHSIGEDPYYLGVFLTGAYQDIMGDHHNLFGRVNEVHVYADPEEHKGYYLEEIIRGSSIEEVLEDTQYDTQDLIRRFKEQVDRAIRRSHIKPSTGMSLLADYRQALSDYTYLTE